MASKSDLQKLVQWQAVQLDYWQDPYEFQCRIVNALMRHGPDDVPADYREALHDFQSLTQNAQFSIKPLGISTLGEYRWSFA